MHQFIGQAAVGQSGCSQQRALETGTASRRKLTNFGVNSLTLPAENRLVAFIDILGCDERSKNLSRRLERKLKGLGIGCQGMDNDADGLFVVPIQLL